MQLTDAEKKVLEYLANAYGADAKHRFEQDLKAFRDLLKDLKQLDIKDPSQIAECEKTNQMLLGVVNPRFTGGYEASPIYRSAAFLQGNPTAIPELNPYQNSSPLETLDELQAQKRNANWPPRLVPKNKPPT